MLNSKSGVRWLSTWKLGGGTQWGVLVKNRLKGDLNVPIRERERPPTPKSEHEELPVKESNFKVKISSEEGSWPWGDERVAKYVRQAISKEIRGESHFRAREVEWRDGPIGCLLDEVLQFKDMGCDVGPLTIEALMRATLEDRDKASTQHIWETVIRKKLTINTNTWNIIMRYHGDNRDLDAVEWTWKAFLKAGNHISHGHEYLKALSRCDKRKAIKFFKETYNHPNEGLCQALLHSASNFSEGSEIIRNMEAKGTFISIRTYGLFLRALAHKKDVANVENIFDQLIRITTPNEMCWNSRLMVYRGTGDVKGIFKVAKEAKKLTHIVLTQVEINVIECVHNRFQSADGRPDDEYYLREAASAAINHALKTLLPADKVQFAIVVYSRFLKAFGRQHELSDFKRLMQDKRTYEGRGMRRTSNHPVSTRKRE